MRHPIVKTPTAPRVSALPLAVALGAFASPALAYVGPGAGLGVIGTLFGIVAAIVLAMVGLLWYPLKRAFGRKTAPAEPLAEPVRAEDGETAGGAARVEERDGRTR